MTLQDAQNDDLKITKIAKDKITLKPLTYKGPDSIFPDDFGDNVTIDDLWQHFDIKD